MRPWIPETVTRALALFAGEARRAFGPRLADVRLFGSYARGDMGADSDIDVLVVVENLDLIRDHAGVWSGIRRALDETGVVLSPVLMDRARLDVLRDRERRFALDVDREGIPL